MRFDSTMFNIEFHHFKGLQMTETWIKISFDEHLIKSAPVNIWQKWKKILEILLQTDSFVFGISHYFILIHKYNNLHSISFIFETWLLNYRLHNDLFERIVFLTVCVGKNIVFMYGKCNWMQRSIVNELRWLKMQRIIVVHIFHSLVLTPFSFSSI